MPVSANCRATSRCRPTSGPQANRALACWVLALAVAAAKLTGLGSSAITFQPVSANLVFSSTAQAAACSSVAQASGISA